jgi:hypothetical protein
MLVIEGKGNRGFTMFAGLILAGVAILAAGTTLVLLGLLHREVARLAMEPTPAVLPVTPPTR